MQVLLAVGRFLILRELSRGEWAIVLIVLISIAAFLLWRNRSRIASWSGRR